MTTATNRTITVDEETLALLFGEWHRRFFENPVELSEVQSDHEDDGEDCGKDCAAYLIDLVDEHRGNTQ